MEQKLKQKLVEALERNDLDSLLRLEISPRQLVTALVRLAYDKETLVGWRAIQAVGVVAKQLVPRDAALLRETTRKLLWSMNDESGGVGWSAPELIGEIVAADPVRFADLIPILANAHDVEEFLFRPGVLYALGRIAEVDPGAVLACRPVILDALADRDARNRILALHLVELLWGHALRTQAWSREEADMVKQRVASMQSDMGEAWVYAGSCFQNRLVGDMSDRIVKLLIN